MALRILSVVETRPGFIKAVAICEAIERFNRRSAHDSIEHLLVSTGHADDPAAFGSYFNDLTAPKPQLFLNAPGTFSPVERSAKTMERFAEVLLRERPHVVLVTGDIASNFDCALVTKRIQSRGATGAQTLMPALAHIESGFRCFDWAMPREMIRIVVDSLSDCLFTTEESASRNLLEEGIPPHKIHLVGSIGIDTLLGHLSQAMKSPILTQLQLIDETTVKPFALLSLQHMSDAGGKHRLSELRLAVSEIARQMPVVFPASPTMLKLIQEADLADYFVDHFLDGPEPWDARVRIRVIPPLGYLDFVRLMAAARVVLTDSSGVQEETWVLRVPCITVADYTCKPAILRHGANLVAGTNPERIMDAFSRTIRETGGYPEPPSEWDGRTADRIVDTLWNNFAQGGTNEKLEAARGMR